ncbi:MAG: hypothetical protein Q9219_003098 [cf. Caloplaca sp. 3 TL-2023]
MHTLIRNSRKSLSETGRIADKAAVVVGEAELQENNSSQKNPDQTSTLGSPSGGDKSLRNSEDHPLEQTRAIAGSLHHPQGSLRFPDLHNDTADTMLLSAGAVAAQHNPGRRRAQSLGEVTRARCFAHPPGYIQNPYALEMPMEQIFATTQEDRDGQGLPIAGSMQSKEANIANIGMDERVGVLWKRARSNTANVIESVHDWLSDTF